MTAACPWCASYRPIAGTNCICTGRCSNDNCKIPPLPAPTTAAERIRELDGYWNRGYEGTVTRQFVDDLLACALAVLNDNDRLRALVADEHTRISQELDNETEAREP